LDNLMKMIKIFSFVLFILVFPVLSNSHQYSNKNGIEIEWVDNIKGNYSFVNDWDYTDYVYKNDFGQLVCDGICNPLIYNMLDSNSKIYEDSLRSYYQLVDTTHIFHSIESNSNCYEWAGTDYIVINKISSDTIKCYTLCSAATHSSLEITLINNRCTASIKLISITNINNPIYYTYKDGYIKIDKYLWNKGVMKAEFEFIFDDHDNPAKDIFWNGKIYAKIN